MSIHLRPYGNKGDDQLVEAFDELMGIGMLRHCQPERDIVFAKAGDEVVGYGRVWLNERNGEHRYFLEVTTTASAPEDAVRKLFVRIEHHTSDLCASYSQGVRASAKVFVTERKGTLERLVQQLGFNVERTDLTMKRSLEGPLPTSALPTDVGLRRADCGIGQFVIDVMAEVFGGERPDLQTKMTPEDFDDWMSGAPASEALSLAAWSIHDGDAASIALNHVDQDRHVGIVSHVATRVSWRKRGIARALIAESLRMFQSLGLREAMLEVNDFNASAISLYKYLGFEVASKIRLYNKTLHSGS